MHPYLARWAKIGTSLRHNNSLNWRLATRARFALAIVNIKMLLLAAAATVTIPIVAQ